MLKQVSSNYPLRPNKVCENMAQLVSSLLYFLSLSDCQFAFPMDVFLHSPKNANQLY